MTDRKHTPGPWAVNPAHAQVDAFRDGQAVPICQMLWPTTERSEAETEANAALIASAPDLLAERDRLREVNASLLAALELAESHIDNVCGETSEADLPDWFADRERIRAAIAKAKGGAG